MTKSNKKGFTLIEILVVIAIIGVLASIVMSSVNSARAKAQDASIKANLNSLRIQAAVYRSDNGDYGMSTDNYGDCNSGGLLVDPDIEEIIVALREINTYEPVCILSDGDINTQDGDIGVMVKSWAISAQLSSNSNISWCVDSSGASMQGDASMIADETALCL